MQVTAPGYYRLRSYLRRQHALYPLLAHIRRLVLAGPLKPALIKYYRAVTRPVPIATQRLGLVEPFAVDEAVDSLRANGFACGLRVTPECVDRLLECYQHRPVPSYANPHRDHELIRGLVREEQLVAVARGYLGAEPVFLSSRLHWYSPSHRAYSSGFHYDAGDVLAVTFFVYLSDVDDVRGSVHQVIGGTHRHKTLGELWARRLPVDHARARYADRIQTITGARGTAWFEDTQAFHRPGHPHTIRKTFSLQYALHRQASRD